MNKTDFTEQMQRLKKWCEESGETDLYKGKERMLYFWHGLKDVPGYIFAEAVTKIVCNFRKPPLLETILKTCKEISSSKKTSYSPETKLPPIEECFVPDEAWIDKTNQEILAIDPEFNAVAAKHQMMGLVKGMK